MNTTVTTSMPKRIWIEPECCAGGDITEQRWAEDNIFDCEDGVEATEYIRADLVAGMLEALRLHKAWADSEDSGPDYGGQTRDTHPDGERIWREWWDIQLSLCDRATRATNAAIAKAEGKE